MQPSEAPPAEIASPPKKKQNLGAKIGVAATLGLVVGGKLTIPGLVIDLNNMFPKDTPLATKFKQSFSKDVIPLVQKAVNHEMQANGRGLFMAFMMATKWSTILPTVGGIILGVIGWKRADLIENSADIVKHPIQSTKIILGLEDPPAKKQEMPKGKYTAALQAERDAQADMLLQR